jgi:hypothetical protein
MNITKIEKGFKIDDRDIDYLFLEQEAEVISEEQCHIPTNGGFVLFDLSVTIEGLSFETIEEWIAELYKESHVL